MVARVNTRPASNDMNVKVVRRKTPGKEETYIMHDNKFLVGLTRKKSEKHEELIANLVAEIQQGSISVDKASCKEFLQKALNS